MPKGKCRENEKEKKKRRRSQDRSKPYLPNLRNEGTKGRSDIKEFWRTGGGQKDWWGVLGWGGGSMHIGGGSLGRKERTS